MMRVCQLAAKRQSASLFATSSAVTILHRGDEFEPLLLSGPSCSSHSTRRRFFVAMVFERRLERG